MLKSGTLVDWMNILRFFFSLFENRKSSFGA